MPDFLADLFDTNPRALQVVEVDGDRIVTHWFGVDDAHDLISLDAPDLYILFDVFKLEQSSVRWASDS